MINVTKTILPPFKVYNRYLKEIWKTNWVTNNGRYVQELEDKLDEYLGINNLLAVANGTLALQLAFKALNLKGEVITTPFTFAATTNSLIWEGLNPVFADIDPKTFNIDPKDVEKKITKNTTAILAVHVYGNPCDVESLEKIAKKHNLKLIFDAAHAFGVEYKNKPILRFGDISILSFHATKTFHTIEGGAIIVRNNEIFNKLKLLRNFGIKSEEEVLLPGINAKMNEFQAIMGLANIPYIDRSRLKRKIIYDYYVEKLKIYKGLRFQEINSSKYNYSYMPVIFKNKFVRNKIYNVLIKNGIKPRKYFFPLTSDFKFISSNMNLPIAKEIADRVLCLPIYENLKRTEIKKIIKVIKYD